VIAPGMAPYVTAAVLAWPLTLTTQAVDRWEGAGVLLIAGVLHAALTAALLHRWALTDAERNKAAAMVRGLTGVFRMSGASV
jgi:hypothetical protein